MSCSAFAIILNWNSALDTIACTDAIARSNYSDVHIVIVDNGSTDCSEQVLREQLGEQYPILQTGDNLGYAGGNRVGVNYALEQDADFVWILNPDCIVQEDTLSNLLAAAHRRGPEALLSPLILHYDQPDLVYYGGAYFDPDAGAPALVSSVRLSDHPELLEERVCDAIHGANVLIPASVIQKYGFMEESYFLYAEEADYSMQLAKHGIPSIYVPSARAYHRGSGSTPENTELRNIALYYRWRNRFLLWRRNLAPVEARRLMWRRVRSEVQMYVWGLRSGRLPSRYRVVALWHGLTGKFGRTYNPSDAVHRQCRREHREADLST